MKVIFKGYSFDFPTSDNCFMSDDVMWDNSPPRNMPFTRINREAVTVTGVPNYPILKPGEVKIDSFKKDEK